MKKKKIEIMDTTLRDGEQMANISYSINEKINIAKILLKDVRVNRIELTSARVSNMEKETIRQIIKSLGESKSFEILAFIDQKKSIDWTYECGGRVINLLTKGSLKHLTVTFNKTPEQHVSDILKEVDFAQSKKMDVNVYLEDWSNGMLYSKDYVFYLIEKIKDSVKRIMLPDTLGILNPAMSALFVGELKKEFPGVFMDFHAHNDYGLATANSLAAVEAGADAIHLTVNGLGERAGNASLEEVVVGINDFMSDRFATDVVENSLYKISRTVELYSGIRMASNKSIVGSNVFTQTAGVHADGDKKGKLYESRLMPERFGREREYALGKLSGKANLEQNLKKIGVELSDEDKKKVLDRIVELGDKKHAITAEDLPYIIDDVVEDREIKKVFNIKSFIATSSLQLNPISTVQVEYKGALYQEIGSGDGAYDAFMNALKKVCEQVKIKIPKLLDYNVQIPPGGKTDALVQTTITWEFKGREFKTKGVNSDQLIAAVEATEKAINKILDI